MSIPCATLSLLKDRLAGTGFYGTTAPWGTKWFGKGSNNAGYSLNFRVPFQVQPCSCLFGPHRQSCLLRAASFQKSVLVSVQHQIQASGEPRVDSSLIWVSFLRCLLVF